MSNLNHDPQFCTLRLGHLRLGIPIEDVQEILYRTPVTAVPGAPGFVNGLLNLRGNITTAIDLRVRLGLETHIEGGDVHLVVLHNDETIAIEVDKVDDVMSIATDQIDPAPSTLPVGVRELLTGVHQQEGELLLLLDVHEALGPLEVAA